MKNRTNSILGAILSFLLTAQITNSAAQVYDLRTDWSDTQNPNGPWSYRDRSGELLPNDPIAWGYGDGSFVSDLISRTTEASVASGFLELGDIFVNAFSWGVTVRWTAPAKGTINISGTGWSIELPLPVEGEFPMPPASYDWTLSHNQNLLRGGITYGTRSNPYDFSSGFLGSSTLQNISIQAGDQINLVFLQPWQVGRMGLNFTITLTPDAVDAVTAIENLAVTIVEMNLQNGIENSLDSKLDAVLNALTDVNVNNDAAACNSLAAFINAVEAQRGDKISNTQADQLIASAHQIETVIGCGADGLFDDEEAAVETPTGT